MSNEIATYSMILSKLSLGKSGTECPTKTQILAINSLIVIDNASTYGANECVKIDDIRKKAETWNYYLTVSPTSMSFGAGGGSKQFTYSSYKRKVLDGVEQSGDISVSLKTTSASGTGFSISGTTVSASANQTASNRTGKITLTQNESNKTATISLSQSGDTISSYGEWTISVSANPTSVSSDGGTSTITATAKRTVYWTSGATTEETGNPTLTTNLGTLNGNILTLGAYTASGSRAATITATYAGKSAICRVAQNGSGTDVSYTFSVNPYTVSVGASGGTGTVSITSYKMVGDNRYNLDYSIDTSTLPSWASFNKSTSTFTIQSTSGSAGRTARVYFTQSESGKRDYAELTQTGYTPPIEDIYVFKWYDQDAEIIEKNFDCTGVSGSYSCELISEWNAYITDFRLSVVGGKPDWITVTHEQTGAKSRYRVNFTLTENNTNLSRNCTVKLEQNGSGKILYLNVTQAAMNIQWRYRFGYTGDRNSISVAIRTKSAYTSLNVTFYSYKSRYVDGVEDTSSRQYLDFAVSSNGSWLTPTKGSSSNTNESKINVQVTSNASNHNNRTATITITQNGSNKTITCSVTQVGIDAYLGTYYYTSKLAEAETGYNQGLPNTIDFGTISNTETKRYLVRSLFKVYTLDSDYSGYDYQFGAGESIINVPVLNVAWSVDIMDRWFQFEFDEYAEINYVDYMLKVTSRKSDGVDHLERLMVSQRGQTTYEEGVDFGRYTNNALLALIDVKCRGIKIS